MSQSMSEDVPVPEAVMPRSWLPEGDQRSVSTVSCAAGSSSSALPVFDQRLTAPTQSEVSSRVATASMSPAGFHAIVVTREGYAGSRIST